jgi:hypothetical protein
LEQLVRRRIWGPPSLALALLALVALAALATGCEHRSQEAPDAGAPAASLVVTADYGARPLLETRVAPGQSVMRALRGATDVRTAYAGAFVSEMLGLRSDLGATLDWFFYVDGIGSSVGAREVDLGDGDAVWWDHRDWGAVPVAAAVVGQWPAPFAPARDGASRPVAADEPLRSALAQAGARVTDGRSSWRVRIGASEELARRDPAWRRALADPDAAGLTVAVEDGRITALDAAAKGREPVPGARALVAAVATGIAPEDGVLLAVAGLDRAAAEAAAARVARDPGVLRLRYAVAFDGEGRPLRAGGRDGP